MTDRTLKDIRSFFDLELKMILRNKKPSNNLIQILLMYFFVLGSYSYLFNKSISNTLTFYMIISLMSSSFIVGHGLFLLTWESTYFNLLMSIRISLRSFFLAKYCLFIFSALILSIVNVPLIMLLGGNLLMYVSFLLFNIGIIPILIVTFSFFNNERASLDRGIFFNYEGYGLWQYLVLMVEILLPGLLFQIFSRVTNLTISLIIIQLLGFFGLSICFFYPVLFFKSRKYKIIDGFNKK